MKRTPIGEGLPPRRDVVQARSAAPLSAPVRVSKGNIVVTKAKDRLLELIEREQIPDTVEQTLAGAFTGDLSKQHLMFQAMVDSWPRLQKNLAEIKRQVRRAPWQIKAHKARGEETPSTEAEERANFVDDALNGMRPRPGYCDLNKEDLIEALADGYFYGHQVAEITWDIEKSDSSIRPSYTRLLPARFYGYSYGVGDEEERLMLNRKGQYHGDHLEDFPENKFLIGINKGHSGHPTVSAPLRALAQYWLAAVYGLKWMMNFTQNFGIPFRWATVADKEDMDAVCQMLEEAGANGYAAFESGTKMELHESSKGSQGSLPQETLLKLADRQCDTFILGQTLTTDVADSGSRALGDVHNQVRLDVMQGIGDYVANIFNSQFIPFLVSLNWGDRDMLPKLLVTFAPSKDEVKKAERDVKLFRDLGLPVEVKYLYERHEIPIPSETAELFQPRSNGVQGDPVTGESEETTPHETKNEAEDKEEKKVSASDATSTRKTTLEELTANVLEGLTGVSRDWLGGVRPFFDRLAALAESDTVTDADFEEALAKAQNQLPELFDALDTVALETAFGEAIGTAMLAGSTRRLEGRL